MKRQLKELLDLSGEMVQIALGERGAPEAPSPSAPGKAGRESGGPLRLLFKPEGWFSKRFRVHLPHGPSLATLDISTWKTWAEITLPTEAYAIRPDKRDGAVVLYHDGRPEAQAVAEGMFSTRYALEWPGGKGTLRMQKGKSNVYELVAPSGEELARMARSGWTGRQMAGTFPAEWPLERALFVSVLVILKWITQDAAAAA